MESILQTQSLSIGYHHRASPRTLANDLNLTLQAGRLTCLVGPNGAGKSTLLRTLAGLQPALKGKILIAGKEAHKLNPQALARLVSVVLTEHTHPGVFAARQIVELGRLPYTDWLGVLSSRDNDIVTEALRQAGAGRLADCSFGELSDGEKQKVMIARALAQEPAVMILDEPTAFLDWTNRVELLTTLRQLARTTERAFLVSSHDLELVTQMADELWVMDCDGIITCGPTAVLLREGVLERVFCASAAQFSAGKLLFRIIDV